MIYTLAYLAKQFYCNFEDYMNKLTTIHLIRTPELPIDLLSGVGELLSSFPGPMQFKIHDYHFNPVQFPFLIHYRDDFEFKKTIKAKKRAFDSSLGHPLSWKELFSLCDFFRKTFSISNDDFIILITMRRNGLNWFSHVTPEKNAFVHSGDWEHFTNVNVVYPVAYEVIENVLQCLMKIDPEISLDGVHMEAVGCMNDFCQQKQEIILKLQTANICDKCIAIMQQEKIPDTSILQALDIFEGIRKQFIYRSHSTLKYGPKRIEVSAVGRLLIPELGNLELSFPTASKTLYLFFLLLEEGAKRSELSNHKDRLLKIYGRISGSDDNDTQINVIKNMISLKTGTFNEAKARVNREVRTKLHEGLIPFYEISGGRNSTYRIELPRGLIDSKIDIRF